MKKLLSSCIVVLVGGSLLGTVITSASDVKDGKTEVTFEPDTTVTPGTGGGSGAVKLLSVPDLVFGKKTLTGDAVYKVSAPATGKFTVKDSRGGSEGYTVTAKASELIYTAPGLSSRLPVQTIKLTTLGDAQNDLAGKSDSEIFGKEAVVLVGGANSNGELSSTATSNIEVGSTGVKAQTYAGTITYTLSDKLTP